MNDDIAQLPATVSRKVFSTMTGIPARTINRMVRDGRLRRIAVGKRGRYPRSEIARVLQTEYQTSAPPAPGRPTP